MERPLTDLSFEVIPFEDGDQVILIKMPGHKLNLNIMQARFVCGWLLHYLSVYDAHMSEEGLDERVSISDEAKLRMIAAMRKYGGAFVIELADLFEHADQENLRRLCIAFPEYVMKYSDPNFVDPGSPNVKEKPP